MILLLVHFLYWDYLIQRHVLMLYKNFGLKLKIILLLLKMEPMQDFQYVFLKFIEITLLLVLYVISIIFLKAVNEARDLVLYNIFKSDDKSNNNNNCAHVFAPVSTIIKYIYSNCTHYFELIDKFKRKS